MQSNSHRFPLRGSHSISEVTSRRRLGSSRAAAQFPVSHPMWGSPPSCAVPDNLLFMDNNLKRVATAVGKERHLVTVVLGTGSSTLAGADGPSQAYPARLGQALNQMLPNIAVRVISRTQGGHTADIMRRSMKDSSV